MAAQNYLLGGFGFAPVAYLITDGLGTFTAAPAVVAEPGTAALASAAAAPTLGEVAASIETADTAAAQLTIGVSP